MAGKATHGLQSADISLFDKATWVFTGDSESKSLPSLLRFVQELGATRFIVMEPEEHDVLVSIISHVPQMVATALAAGVSHQDEYSDAVQIAGGGFKDTTRLASSPWDMWGPVIKGNREALIIPLTKVRDLLDEMIRDLLASESDRIKPIFLQANQARKAYEERDSSYLSSKGDMKINNGIEVVDGKAWLDNSLGYKTVRTTANTSYGHMRLALLLMAEIKGIEVNPDRLIKNSEMVQQIAELVEGDYETTWTADGLPVEGVVVSNVFYVIP